MSGRAAEATCVAVPVWLAFHPVWALVQCQLAAKAFPQHASCWGLMPRHRWWWWTSGGGPVPNPRPNSHPSSSPLPRPQDPYCIVKCGGQTFKTRTAKDGGKNPVWNETFTVGVVSGSEHQRPVCSVFTREGRLLRNAHGLG